MRKIVDICMAIFTVAVPTFAISAFIWMLVVWTQCLVSMADSLRKLAEKLC